METGKISPLWLEIKKEYIDDNFDNLLVYLKDSSTTTKDSFYNLTLQLLKQRVEDLLESISSRPLYDDVDKATLTFHIKLMGSYLLAETNGPLSTVVYVAFMTELRELTPQYTDEISRKVMERICFEKITKLGFGWSDLDAIGTELFTHKACVNAVFDTPLTKSKMFDKLGTVCLNSKGLYIMRDSLDKAKKLLTEGSESLDTGIGIKVKTASSQKLKQSQEHDHVAIEEYTNHFIEELHKLKPRKVIQKLKTYAVGDKLVLRITNISKDGTIHVETTDAKYEKIFGIITYTRKSLVYYYTSDFYKYLKVGQCLRATLTDAIHPTFSFEDEFVHFLVEYAIEEQRESDIFLAKLIDINKKAYVWITDLGIPMFTPNSNDYNRGDFGLLEITNYGTGSYYGKIDAKIVYDPNLSEDFDELEARRDCICYFTQLSRPVASVETPTDYEDLDPLVLKMLIRLLFQQQKQFLKPSERFRYLSVARIMAEMVEDKLASSYIKFAGTYLRVLVNFVNRKSVGSIKLYPEPEYQNARSTLLRLSIVELLKEYGRKDNSEKLASVIEDFKDNEPMLSRLARLIQTANSMQGILSDSSLNIIRREIIKTLSLETEGDTDLEGDSSAPFLGVESGTQEFKTSMVYPSSNQMQPNETLQNHHVMKGVCAFLNSVIGGTLYLGVNDQGYGVGVAEDMKYLKQQTIDSYMRYVQDTAKKYFGVDALPYIHIESMYDGSIISIRVKPHPYRVVELDGVAYLRVNAESRQMPEQMRLELIGQKVFKDKNKAAIISLLQHANTLRKCAILHDYASSNSGTVSDRMVEPYEIRPDDDLVICFDRDKKSVRVFNLNRIGYVDILENQDWGYTSLHQKVNVDAFHMTGSTPIHISLQLDLFAKNLLVERYPSSKADIKNDKGDVNTWYLDTNVYNIEALASFYLGLANHIKIIDAPKLKEYVDEYKMKYL